MTVVLRFSFLALGLLMTLGACSDVRDSLGLGRSTPDEFAVVDRPPLALPPDFSLRPPEPGAPRPQDVNTTQRASDILFAADNPGAAKPAAPAAATDIEKAVLALAGADKANPDIRTIIDHEAAEKVVGNRHLVDELLWWKKEQPDATMVDAPKEAERIKQAKEKGEPLDQTPTPVIEKQKTGWLGI